MGPSAPQKRVSRAPAQASPEPLGIPALGPWNTGGPRAFSITLPEGPQGSWGPPGTVGETGDSQFNSGSF